MKNIIIITCLTFLSGNLFAGKLAEKKMQKETAEEMAKLSAEVSKDCGSKIKVSAKGISLKMHKEYSIKGYCGDISSGVATVCKKGKDEKSAVTSQIKKIVCDFSGKDKKISQSVKSGVYTAKFSVDTPNLTYAYKWLLENL